MTSVFWMLPFSSSTPLCLKPSHSTFYRNVLKLIFSFINYLSDEDHKQMGVLLNNEVK